MKYKICSLILFICNCLHAQHDAFLKGSAAVIKQQTDSAVFYFSEAIKLKDSKYEYYLLRADCYYNLKNYSQSINDYLQANKLQANSGDFGLAKCYARTGKTTETIDFLKKHLLSGYRLPQKIIKLEPAFNQMEKIKEWQELWKQEWYTKYEYSLNEAEYLVSIKDYTEAINLISKSIAEHEKKHELYALRAKVYVETNNLNNALADYNEAIKLAKRKNEYYRERAQINNKLKNYKDAVDDYSKAIEINPADFDSYLQRADVYRKMKMYDDAIKDLNFFLMYFNNDEDANYIASNTYFDQENYFKSLEYINKNIKKNPNLAKYYMMRGNNYLKTNTFKYAIKDYTMALDLDPNNSETWFNKGLARYSNGDKNGACLDWQKAVRMSNAMAIQYYNEKCGK